MRTLLSFAFAAALAASSLPAFAQTAAGAGAVPACPANDPVVWLNTDSNVFHLKGDRYFGHTKSGKYACESQAAAAGGHQSKEGVKAGTATAAPGAPAGATATPVPKKRSFFGGSPTTAPGSANGATATATPSGKHHHKSKASPAPGAAAPVATATPSGKHHHKSKASPAPGATAKP